jgi:DMSO/TMAO reductase YedYZ molybdopterin-dependent catalytic subunit
MSERVPPPEPDRPSLLTRARTLPPPPGPFRRSSWRSPLRGPWLTSVLGLVLLIGIPIVAVTGLLSYAAYDPALGGTNDQTPTKGLLGAYLFEWPTSPVWLYRLNQGTHVLLGLALVPVLLGKLWSVLPKLFEWPPVRSPAQALERLTLALLVGGAILTFATGVINIQIYYPWSFSFYEAHFYAAWVFLAGFVSHVALKLPVMLRSLRARRLRDELRTPLAGTRAEPLDPDGLVATDPAEPTMSRRGALAVVGGSSLLLFALSVGQVISGPLRRTALLAPRGQVIGDGPNDFQVNRTAASVDVDGTNAGPTWRLQLVGAGGETVGPPLSREDLLALEQHTYDLPIACVEGWSTVQTWTGVRVRDLAAMAGVPEAGSCFVESLQRGGFGTGTLSRGQVADARTLLALKVNGADLSLDHGFPARLMIPAAPGVRNTKWVTSLTFRDA